AAGGRGGAHRRGGAAHCPADRAAADPASWRRRSRRPGRAAARPEQQPPPPSRPLRPAGSLPCPVPPCRTGRRGARLRAAAISPGTGSGGASVEEEEEGAAAIMAGLSRTLGIFGGFVAVVGAALYPIYFRPLLLPDEYKKEQSINRAGIVQEDIQPPGLKVWSDPFGRK
uniref:Small integral membrane protein 20 n=1 Tax=Anser brachyrhynchus TaxID=132585 RepID=A0A8B9CCF3_9AVES